MITLESYARADVIFPMSGQLIFMRMIDMLHAYRQRAIVKHNHVKLNKLHLAFHGYSNQRLRMMSKAYHMNGRDFRRYAREGDIECIMKYGVIKRRLNGGFVARYIKTSV